MIISSWFQKFLPVLVRCRLKWCSSCHGLCSWLKKAKIRSTRKCVCECVCGGDLLEKSMNAWNIVVVHLKENVSSINQTWWTGPIHQSALQISYWVQLRRDKCRTSSVFPRLQIDRDHHCDVAFYLTTCFFKPYIIPNTDISKEEEGWEGHHSDLVSPHMGIIYSNYFQELLPPKMLWKCFNAT